MTLDDGLLEKSRKAASRLADAERKVLLSRADYHTAVRRLHLGGGSLREIAETLGLSHQRVAQIVAAAGGSWWQRVWRTRTVRRDAVCTFCQRPPGEVSKLIAGPNVYICDACVAAGEETLSGAMRRGGSSSAARGGGKGRCSFCGKRKEVFAATARVCAGCLALCREILDGRTA